MKESGKLSITEVRKKNDEKGTILWPQFIGGIGVTLLLNQIGLITAWTSPYIAQLREENSPLPLTKFEESMVVSLLNLGRFIGAICGAVFVNYFGSKTGIFVTSIPMVLCWVFIIAANRVEWLYASRICGGLGMGMSYSSFPLYIGEMANPSIRGALVTLGMCGMSAGNLIITVLGSYFSKEISGAVCLALALVLFFLFLWLPQTPHYLISKNDEKGTKSALLWYHRDCDVETELDALSKFVASSKQQTFLQSLAEFRMPHIRKCLIVCIMLFFYSQMCGLNNVLFYMESILISAQVVSLTPSTVTIIVMASGIVASGFSMFLIDRYGRKWLLICSCIIVSIALVCLGTQFALVEYDQPGFDASSFEWLPILAMILFQIAAFAGILPVPGAVLGELFAPNIKCVAACIGSISAGVFAFIAAITYQPLIDSIKAQYTFWLYAIIQLTAIPFVAFVMPETKGRTLQEIQSDLMKSK